MDLPFLIADDDSVFMWDLTCHFSQEKCLKSQSIRTSQQLRVALSSQQFSGLILEPNLPGGTWWSNMEIVRSRGLSHRTVVVTSYESAALVRRAQTLGVRAIIVKPVGAPSVVSALLDDDWQSPSRSSHVDQSLAGVEWEYLNRAILSANGKIAQAARLLGIPRQTLYRKLRKLPRKEHAPAPPLSVIEIEESACRK